MAKHKKKEEGCSEEIATWYLTNTRSNHYKFYELKIVENPTTNPTKERYKYSLWVRYGRIGAKGVTRIVESSPTNVILEKTAEKLLRSKQDKGYILHENKEIVKIPVKKSKDPFLARLDSILE